MRSLVYTAPRELTLRDTPEPNARPDQAVVKVIGTGICGSDMSGFLGHSPRRQPPLVLGHEVVGTVVQTPPGEWPFKMGDRVVANPLQGCGACDQCRVARPNLCGSWQLIGIDRT